METINSKKRKIDDAASPESGCPGEPKRTANGGDPSNRKLEQDYLEAAHREIASLRAKLAASEKTCAAVSSQMEGRASNVGDLSACRVKPTHHRDASSGAFVFPRIHSSMDTSELKAEAWERGYAAPDAATKEELLELLHTGTISLSAAKKITYQELRTFNPSSSDDKDETAADIFLSHGLPFLKIDEMYDTIFLVAKSFYQNCRRELVNRCKAIHPSLLASMELSPRMDLTYSMFKRFDLGPRESSARGEPWKDLKISDLGPEGDIDVLFEFTFDGKIFRYGVAPLCHDTATRAIHATFDIDNFPGAVALTNNSENGLRVRTRHDNEQEHHYYKYWNGSEDVSIEQKAIVKAFYGSSSKSRNDFAHPKLCSFEVRAVLRRRSDGTMITILKEDEPGRIIGEDYGWPIGHYIIDYCDDGFLPVWNDNVLLSVVCSPKLVPTLSFEIFSDSNAPNQDEKVAFSTMPPQTRNSSGRKLPEVSSKSAKVYFQMRLDRKRSCSPWDEDRRPEFIALENAEYQILNTLRTWKWG